MDDRNDSTSSYIRHCKWRNPEPLYTLHEGAPHIEFKPPPHLHTMHTHAHDKTAVVAFLIVCWYFASSKNAIATQHLVQDYLNTSPHAPVEQNLDTLHFATTAYFTALQLLVGLVIVSILAIIVAPSTSSCNDRSTKYICCIKTNGTNGMRALIIGCSHYCGCL